MKSIINEERIEVNGVVFIIEIFNDFEVMFRRADSRLDSMGYEIGDYERVSSNPIVAIRLFREISKYLARYVNEKKPPYIYFSAGHDESRFSLYARLARKLAIHGYVYAEDESRPNIFYCYKG